jgi:8-oxo-dGTP diphosphatase
MNVTKEVEKLYGNRLRLRVCGICIRDNSLLLVQHRGLGPSDEFWSPPGGGMEWGSTAEQNVEREFLEETGLQVAVGPLLFVWEHLGPPLHAVELFFEVSVLGGSLRTGADPESPPDAQLIRNVSFMDWDHIKALPASTLHRALQQCTSLEDLKNMYGYFKFCV